MITKFTKENKVRNAELCIQQIQSITDIPDSVEILDFIFSESRLSLYAEVEREKIHGISQWRKLDLFSALDKVTGGKVTLPTSSELEIFLKKIMGVVEEKPVLDDENLQYLMLILFHACIALKQHVVSISSYFGVEIPKDLPCTIHVLERSLNGFEEEK